VARRVEGGDGEAGPDQPWRVRTTPRCLNRVAQGASMRGPRPTAEGRGRGEARGPTREKGKWVESKDFLFIQINFKLVQIVLIKTWT
jgi:hypothetical protein